MTYSCAYFSRRRGDARPRPRRPSSSGLPPSSSSQPGSACSMSAAAGGASPSMPPRTSASRSSGSRLSEQQVSSGASGRGRPASSDRVSCGSPTIASWPASRSTRSRASAWSSTSARSGSTSTRRPWGAVAPGRSAAQPWDRQARGLRHHRRGRVLGAVRVPRRRAAAAVASRAGDRAHRLRRPRHVEGLAARITPRTLRYWIAGYEERYEEAVAPRRRGTGSRLAAVPARRAPGFTTGWASVYQVLADKPGERLRSPG